MLIVLTLVRIITNESGIFKQKRIGRNGNDFTIYKFRTMKNSLMSAEYSNYLKDCESKGILVKIADDPRLFGFGKFLRKTSIDELPQLFNVLIGNMSLVGPRPVIPFIVAPYPEANNARTLVKPGISGLWQVSARGNNLSILQMISYDIEYIRKCSLLLDIKILLKTISVVIGCKGAM